MAETRKYQRRGRSVRSAFTRFALSRTDGQDGHGMPHHGCEYFVLDITCDPFAVPALIAYARACQAGQPQLAEELYSRVGDRMPVEAEQTEH